MSSLAVNLHLRLMVGLEEGYGDLEGLSSDLSIQIFLWLSKEGGSFQLLGQSNCVAIPEGYCSTALDSGRFVKKETILYDIYRF